LGPRDVWIYSVAIPTVRARDHILASHDVGIAHDPMGHEFRGLDGGSLVCDNARDVDLAIWELDVLPNVVVEFVPYVRCLDRIGLGFDFEHEVHDVLEGDVGGMGRMPAAPARVVAHPVFSDVAEGPVG